MPADEEARGYLPPNVNPCPTRRHRMPDLPTGTVTFLFTDIEGSTRLWEKHPTAMREALARHDAILRSAIETAGGHVFKTIGDAFDAVFPRAVDAATAAVAIQRALEAQACAVPRGLQVRGALHTRTADKPGT